MLLSFLKNKFIVCMGLICIYMFYKYMIVGIACCIIYSLIKAFNVYYFTKNTTCIIRKIEYMRYFKLTWVGLIELMLDSCFYTFLQNKILYDVFIIRPKLTFLFFLERIIFYFFGVNKLMWWFLKNIIFSRQIINIKFIIMKSLLGTSNKKILFINNVWYVNSDKWKPFVEFSSKTVPELDTNTKLRLFNEVNKRMDPILAYTYPMKAQFGVLPSQYSSKRHLFLFNTFKHSDSVLMFTSKSKALEYDYYNFTHIGDFQLCKLSSGLKVPIKGINFVSDSYEINNLPLISNFWVTEELLCDDFLLKKTWASVDDTITKFYIEFNHYNIPYPLFKQLVIYQMFLFHNNLYCNSIFNSKISLQDQHDLVLHNLKYFK